MALLLAWRLNWTSAAPPTHINWIRVVLCFLKLGSVKLTLACKAELIVINGHFKGTAGQITELSTP